MATHDENGNNIPEQKPSDDQDLFDQLQKEFDALISSEAPPQSDVSDPLLDDTSAFYSTIDMGLPALTPEQPSDVEVAGEESNDDETEHVEPADEVDTTNPFEEDVPHADMSGTNQTRNNGSGRFIALASAIVLTTVAGIYWLVASNGEQPDHPAVASKETIATNHRQQASGQSAVGQHPETGKAAIQRAAAEKTKARRLAAEQAATKQAAAEKTKARRLAAEQAATKQAAAEKAKARRLAAEQAATKQAAAEKAASSHVTVIQPSTPLARKLPVSGQMVNVLDGAGNWVIDLASVNSDKSARQHVARIRAMGVESEVVKVNDKGRIFHHIRVVGFSSKQAAMKRRDALVKQLGLRDATIEKL